MSDASGFRCPSCGGATRIIETRMIPGGLRRRRYCVTALCGVKVTTAEVAVTTTTHIRSRPGPVVAVRRKDLQAIVALASVSLAGHQLDEDS